MNPACHIPRALAASACLAASLLAARSFGQSMSVDSLDGPVTSNEVNSFVSYIDSLSPVVWPNTTSMENQYAQGASGEQIKAMGLMYEISGNVSILNQMISFCDTLLSQRNDILAAPNGQRAYWNGQIAPAWPGQAVGTASSGTYSTSASGDCVGHLASCARLILLTPSIWNTTVPDGNPFGFGATYFERAQTYVQQADTTFNHYFFSAMLTLNNSGLTNIYCYPSGYPYQPGNQYPWNQAMMMSYPLQNLAIDHQVLGDNPSLVSEYDALVSTNILRFFNDSSNTLHQLYTDSAGNPAYNWSYTPTANGGEDSNHGSLDVAGFYRAYATGRYGISSSQMTPFANMVVDVLTGTIGSYYHGRVDGTDGTGHAASTTYLRSGYFFTADFRADQYYNMVQGLHITAPGTTTSIDAFSRLMYIKNKRYLASNNFTLSASPSSASVTAGASAAYTVSVGATGSFSGAVSLSASGLPSGVTASFSSASVNAPGASTLTLATSASTPAGSYAITISGSNGSIYDTQSTTATLVVSSGSSSLPSGWADVDVGSPPLAGSASYSSGLFTLKGCGADIYGASDQFNYAYQSISGGVTVTAKVASQTNTNGWAKSGVMIRESTAGGSSYVGVYITPSNGVDMQYRNGTGTSAVDLARISGVTAPYWVRLVSSGSTFTGYASSDGNTWTQVGSVNVSMASTATAGLAVCSHNTASLCTATFSGVSVNANSSSNTNIAPSGTAYGWYGMSSSTATTNQNAQPGLNDGNLTTDIDLDSNGDFIGAWEAGGVIWSGTHTITSADFINGDITSGGDGFLTANLTLQMTTDGTTWTNTGWTCSPAYPYGSSAGGQTYTFSGSTLTGVKGLRFAGQVRTTDTSYHWILKEVQFVGQ